MAVGGLVAQQLGETEKAQDYFDEARNRYRSMLDAGDGVLSPYWRDEVLIELFLKEAGQW